MYKKRKTNQEQTWTTCGRISSIKRCNTGQKSRIRCHSMAPPIQPPFIDISDSFTCAQIRMKVEKTYCATLEYWEEPWPNLYRLRYHVRKGSRGRLQLPCVTSLLAHHHHQPAQHHTLSSKPPPSSSLSLPSTNCFSLSLSAFRRTTNSSQAILTFTPW